MRIGERIAALRVAGGLSQVQLAQRVGVTAPHISRVEAGINNNLGSDLVVRLADVLHTSPDYLLLGRSDTDGGNGWDGNDRRRALQETYRALLNQEPNIDDQTLRWLDKQFASFVEQVGEDRRRVRKMAEQAALAPVTDGAAPVTAGTTVNR